MRCVAVDTETTGPDVWHGCRPFMVTAATETGSCLLWERRVDPVTRRPEPFDRKDVAEIRKLLWGNKIVFHNALFDVPMLEAAGVLEDAEEFFRDGTYDDTMVQASCMDSLGERGLKPLCVRLGIPDDDERELHQAASQCRPHARRLRWRVADMGDPHFPGWAQAPKGGWSLFDFFMPAEFARHSQLAGDKDYEDGTHTYFTVCARYGSRDAERTLVLGDHVSKVLARDGLMDRYEFQLSTLLGTYRMMKRGLHTRKSTGLRLRVGFDRAATGYAAQAGKVVGRAVNVHSSKQLTELMFGEWNLPVYGRTDSGAPSTKDEVLVRLCEELKPGSAQYKLLKIVQLVRKCARVSTSVEGYLRGLDSVEVLHPSFNPVGTPVNRFACKNPNAQAIRKRDWELPEMEALSMKVREMFGPAKGREWWSIDFDQLHLRLFAYLSRDERLMEVYDTDGDMHTLMAMTVFDVDQDGVSQGMRRIAKDINYGFIYGAGGPKINSVVKRAELIGRVRQQVRSSGLYGTLRETYPNAIRITEELAGQARDKGYILTADGHRLVVPRKEARKAINYYIQGTEGFVVKWSLIECDRYLHERTNDRIGIAAQIHDELLFDAWYGAASSEHVSALCDIMVRSCEQIGVRMKVDCKLIRRDWAHGEPLSMVRV